MKRGVVVQTTTVCTDKEEMQTTYRQLHWDSLVERTALFVSKYGLREGYLKDRILEDNWKSDVDDENR